MSIPTRFTPELAKAAMEKFGVKLEQWTWGFASDYTNDFKEGCACALLMLNSAGSFEALRSKVKAMGYRSFYDYMHRSAELCGVSTDYFMGLEAGFDNKVDSLDYYYPDGVRSPDLTTGIEDGKALQALLEKTHEETDG